MNKVILGLLVAVCVLGMALIMLNERLRKPEPATPAGIIAPVTPPDAAPPVGAGSPVAAPSPAGSPTATTSPQPYLPPQSQAGIPDRNASSEAPARAPIPSLKPDEKAAPARTVSSDVRWPSASANAVCMAEIFPLYRYAEPTILGSLFLSMQSIPQKYRKVNRTVHCLSTVRQYIRKEQ